VLVARSCLDRAGLIAMAASPDAKSSKVLRFRKGKATKEDLLAGAALLDKFS
jgi:hypothetical protein